MRRYELMLVLRPDVPDDKSQALVDRTTRGIVAAGGRIVKVAPWGRRRLAYPIDRHREGSYHIILFEAPSEAIVELEHTLLITEEVLRHLVTRVDRPSKTARPDGEELDGLDGLETEALAPDLDEDDEDRIPTAFIDESESEAAPAAID
jgi:small subunit ribosomal protein S6